MYLWFHFIVQIFSCFVLDMFDTWDIFDTVFGLNNCVKIFYYSIKLNQRYIFFVYCYKLR